MIEQIKMVEDFHQRMGLTVNKTPQNPGIEIAELRDKLHKEECWETSVELAHTNGFDIASLAKELADMCYVVFGTVVSYGLQDKFEAVFAEIHRANMSKLDDEGNPIINGQNGVLDSSRPLGKVLKGPNYKPADIINIFK